MIQATANPTTCHAIHALCERSVYRLSKKAAVLSSLIWAVLILAIPCEGFVCVHPTTTRVQVSLETLLRLKDPSRSYGTTLSCCFLTSNRIAPSDDQNIQARTNTRLFISLNEEDDSDTPTGKLTGFLQQFRDWTQGLHLTPKFIALLKKKVQLSRQKTIDIVQETKEEKVGALLDAEQSTVKSAHQKVPNGPRWAITANHTNLSGVWKPISTAQFKKDYDSYLLNCGNNFVFRQIIVNGMGLQKEYITQKEKGRELDIVATNPAGNWNRTLVTSGADMDQDMFEPINVTIRDPDGDMVEVEAWWEEGGTVHKSWLRGKPRVHGGEFETARYLESKDVLICDSKFHPSPTAPASKKLRFAHVVWRFERVE